MKRIYLILLSVLFTSIIHAQTFTIKGVVVDEKNLAFEAVTCILHNGYYSYPKALITDILG